MEAPFLPAIAEMLLHLAPRPSSENFTALPGSPLAWADLAADASTPPALETPDSTPLEPVATGTTWKAETRAVPGIYRWLVSGQPVHLTATNFPASESDLAPMETPPSTAGTTKTTISSSSSLLSTGLPLWPYLIAAALLFLLLEPLVETLSSRSSPITNNQ